jgi:signal transduction histidine kinase
MKAVWRGLREYGASLAARITLLLAIGMAGASIASLFVAERVRTHDLQLLQRERVAASSADMASRFAHDPTLTEDTLRRREFFGVRPPFPGIRVAPAEPRLTELLVARMPAYAHPRVARIVSACFPEMFDKAKRVAGLEGAMAIECWRVSFTDQGGVRRHVIIDLPALHVPRSTTLDPIYLVLILLASMVLSALAARLATVPLRRLTTAARGFSLSIDPEPIPENGPAEVRTALATFNLMQQRVRDGFRERTHILAAIAHDLQTPLTRLRLRLEQVADTPLRERLITDLHNTQALVRDGLDLARSTESREPWSIVDIDSLVGSLVEDAAELGAPVRLVASCGVSARVKPDALTRCLNNIIDNALKYGGDADVRCEAHGDMVEIVVRDHGPGFPPDRIQEMFEPFVRGETSRSRQTGGTGIGLTIARAQAQAFGALLYLANHPQGGAIVRLRFPLQR